MNVRQRIRWSLAALAILVAMWATVDLHQHDTGWHTLTSCSLCMLKDAVTHGFAPQSDDHATADIVPDTAASQAVHTTPFQLAQTYPIRAPPVL